MHCESNTAASQETAISAFSLILASGKLLLQKKEESSLGFPIWGLSKGFTRGTKRKTANHQEAEIGSTESHAATWDTVGAHILSEVESSRLEGLKKKEYYFSSRQKPAE